MPLNIQPPVEKEYILEKSDKALGNDGEPTVIKVIQAREGANIERMELWKKFERRFQDQGDITVTQEISPAIVRRKEVFLTLVACNLTTGEAPNTKSLFSFPLKENEFNKAWATLPPVLADEIHEKVLEMNLDWAYSGEGIS